MFNDLKILASYDDRGIVYDNEDHILREIYKESELYANTIYDYYKKYNLSNLGIVSADLIEFNNKFFFKHPKYIISYPHEWSLSMIKDASIFHTELLLDLYKYDLILKDAHLTNILFNFNKFIFVDFFSIVEKNKLGDELWLKNTGLNDFGKLFKFIFNKMFFPYILLPLFLLERKKYKIARYILSEGSCNINTKLPSWKLLFDDSNFKNIFSSYLYKTKKNFDLKLASHKKFNFFLKDILEIIKNVDVINNNSSYVSYYEDKKEDFSFDNSLNWKNKQKNIFSLLTRLKPKRVLDVGANIGWFSILASKQGADVIAMDIDESCLDKLYNISKVNSFNILPLVLSFEDLERKILGLEYSGTIYKKRNFKENPIFLPGVERLQSDLVLCLALSHHLVLGNNSSFNTIFRIFAKLSKKYLVFEFIDLDDFLIKNNDHSKYFLNLINYSLDTYNINVAIKEGLKFFKKVELLDSHPQTRKLLIFEK